MSEYTDCFTAYENGYQQGKADAIDDFLDLLYFNFNVSEKNKMKIAKLVEQIKEQKNG